jgi:hypothetical protein
MTPEPPIPDTVRRQIERIDARIATHSHALVMWMNRWGEGQDGPVVVGIQEYTPEGCREVMDKLLDERSRLTDPKGLNS